MNSKALANLNPSGEQKKMPVLFLGHGNPMNAIMENKFVQGWRQVAGEIHEPSAILCISAHWETRGTKLTTMEQPKTIHDFGGFPKALFEVQYPAPGSPELAKYTQQQIQSTLIELDHDWGLDHGAWSVIKHMYHKANIPIVEMSLDYTKPPKYHYELARELSFLRKKGVLIIGSGNVVHNLRMAAWDRLDEEFSYDWAEESNDLIEKSVMHGDHSKLWNYAAQGRSLDLAVPTPEHFLPLLYVMGLQSKNEDVQLFNKATLAGSLSMTSLKVG
ncbi:MAG: 4,5-DOPA dioxygenase extradiol [Cytophagales bacterium]|nr:4,5-DOPA dioxygenase extradiol [Cytophagales bacterium]